MSVTFFKNKKEINNLSIQNILNDWTIKDFESNNLSFLFKHIYVEYSTCKTTRKNIILFILKIIECYNKKNIKPENTYFLDILYFLRCIKMQKLTCIFYTFLENIQYPIIPFQGLTYITNSCYMDSVLVSLLCSPNKITQNMLKVKYNKTLVNFTNNALENLQNELLNIQYKMYYNNEKYNCKKLKNILRYFNTSQKYYSDQMQDSGEFLYTLFNIFNLNTIKRKRKTYVWDRNFIKVSDVIEDCNPIYNISVFSLIKNESINIIDFLEEINDEKLDINNAYVLGDKKYYRKIDVYKLESAEYIIFNIDRKCIYNNRKINKKVTCPENIYIGNNVLFLNSVIVHENLHYTAYIKIGRLWYYYDDNPGQDNCILKKIGFYDDILKYNIENNGTLFFYS
jgi:hypothetical protein